MPIGCQSALLQQNRDPAEGDTRPLEAATNKMAGERKRKMKIERKYDVSVSVDLESIKGEWVTHEIEAALEEIISEIIAAWYTTAFAHVESVRYTYGAGALQGDVRAELIREYGRAYGAFMKEYGEYGISHSFGQKYTYKDLFLTEKWMPHLREDGLISRFTEAGIDEFNAEKLAMRVRSHARKVAFS